MVEIAESVGERPVRSRTVFYIAGFDPRGPAYYHKLYAAEGAKQSAINGVPLAVSKRKPAEDHVVQWTVTSGDTVSEFCFLRYEDIVRARWPSGGFAMYRAILNYSWHFLRMGVFRMIYRNSWPAFLAVTYPGGLVALLFSVATVLGVGVGLLLQLWLGPLAWAFAATLLALPFALYKVLEKSLNAFWLARSCAFLVDRSLGRVPEIETRCLAFADRVAEALNRDETDEVLLITHSVGTQLGVTVAARALERSASGNRLSFLTLGQAIAMTPSEPAAQQFRDDLLAISVSQRVDWIDITSAIDGSCIALSDPLALSGVQRSAGARVQPKLVSARFNTLFKPETYEAMRRDFYRIHFQYMMASELPGEYDYFLITASDKSLTGRFSQTESVTGFNRFRRGKS